MKEQHLKDFYDLNMKTYDDDDMPNVYNGWSRYDGYENDKTGFKGWAYVKDGKLLMIVKGTDRNKPNDWKNDWALARNRLNSQVKDTKYFRDRLVTKNNGKRKFIMTGYSLGGSNVMAVAAATGDKAYTFSAFGVRDILGSSAKYSDNIINIGYHKDPIFNSNRDNMVGKVYMTGKKGEAIKITKTDPAKIYTHIPQFSYDLDNIQEYKSQPHAHAKERILNGNFSLYHHVSKKEREEINHTIAKDLKDRTKNYAKNKISEKLDSEASELKHRAAFVLRPAQRLEDRLRREWSERTHSAKEAIKKFNSQKTLAGYVNYFTKSDRIYTQEEIENMTPKKRKNLKEAIEYQKNKIGLPTKEMAQKTVQSGGMVHVKEYVRDGGVKVKSYYRARPSR